MARRRTPASAAAAALWGAALLLQAAPLGAQEASPAPDGAPGSRRAAPPVPAPPGEERLFLPEDRYDPAYFPPPAVRPAEPPPADAPRGFWEQIELKLDGYLRAGLGHDTNVFRADHGRTADGFAHGEGEVRTLLRFPRGSELYVEVAAESLDYFEHHRASEHLVTTYVEYFHPVTTWLDVGVQNALDWSRFNLLNDDGDLLPRGRFGSLDEDVRLYAVLRPHDDLALEAGASWRWKDYDENRGLDSLDYEEARLDGSIGWRLARDPHARVKLKYRFRRRDYRQLRARDRDGQDAPGMPHLDLQRHEVNLTWVQGLRLFGLEARFVLGAGGVYNRDLFAGDRSYRELSTSARLELWLVPEATRLTATLLAMGREFLVRRTVGRGGHLRQRRLDTTVTLWQKLGGWPVALWVEGTATHWDTTDPLQDYERFLVQGGLEVFW